MSAIEQNITCVEVLELRGDKEKVSELADHESTEIAEALLAAEEYDYCVTLQ